MKWKVRARNSTGDGAEIDGACARSQDASQERHQANVGKPNTKYKKLRKLPSDNAIVVVLVWQLWGSANCQTCLHNGAVPTAQCQRRRENGAATTTQQQRRSDNGAATTAQQHRRSDNGAAATTRRSNTAQPLPQNHHGGFCAHTQNQKTGFSRLSTGPIYY